MSHRIALPPESANRAQSRRERIAVAVREYFRAAEHGIPDAQQFLHQYSDIADELLPLITNASASESTAVPDRSQLSPGTLRLTLADGRSHTFDRSGAFLIGRSTRAQFAMASGPGGDLLISHAHCLVEFEPPLCQIHDLNSNNGTYVNGKRVVTSALCDGDEVRIGHTVMNVRMAPSPEKLESETSYAAEIESFRDSPYPADGRTRCPLCLRFSKEPASEMCEKCTARAERLPQPIPGYRLVRAQGRGSHGNVYVALRQQTGRAVAIEVIECEKTPALASIRQFKCEIDRLKQLRHRHIAAFCEAGFIDDIAYVVKEFIRGTDVSSLIARGPLSKVAAVRIVCQLLSALKCGHEMRIAHGDVRPANLLIRMKASGNTLKVANFGLARICRAARIPEPVLSSKVRGTTAFLAPERVLDAHNATAASDQYSAAATLYSLLTNNHVYDRPPRVVDQLAQILDGDIVPIRERRSDLPPKLIGAIHRALSRDPGRRFPGVAAFKQALLPFA